MNEKTARIVAVLVLLGGVAVIGVAWWQGRANTITLHARMPEAGGWGLSDLTVAVGQPLHLRLTSDDVMHGFAIGQSDQPAVDVKPGEITETTITFDTPGTYTFYCTRWCGANHWRMRGTITVTGDGDEEAVEPPLFLQLGLDIDAPHTAESLPTEQPSAQRGRALGLDLTEYQSTTYYRSHSPEEVWQALQDNANLNAYSDQELWDVVAAIWQAQTTPAALAEAKTLYAQNCAACHGEFGNGKGVFNGNQVQIEGEAVHPTDFTDPELVLSASPALLQGKLVRGGMGTGMPMWGTIFTEEQTWALVSYLYTFQFEEAQ